MLDTGTHWDAFHGQFFMKNISGDGDKSSFSLQIPYED